MEVPLFYVFDLDIQLVIQCYAFLVSNGVSSYIVDHFFRSWGNSRFKGVVDGMVSSNSILLG